MKEKIKSSLKKKSMLKTFIGIYNQIGSEDLINNIFLYQQSQRFFVYTETYNSCSI